MAEQDRQLSLEEAAKRRKKLLPELLGLSPDSQQAKILASLWVPCSPVHCLYQISDGDTSFFQPKKPGKKYEMIFLSIRETATGSAAKLSRSNRDTAVSAEIDVLYNREGRDRLTFHTKIGEDEETSTFWRTSSDESGAFQCNGTLVNGPALFEIMTQLEVLDRTSLQEVKTETIKPSG